MKVLFRVTERLHDTLSFRIFTGPKYHQVYDCGHKLYNGPCCLSSLLQGSPHSAFPYFVKCSSQQMLGSCHLVQCYCLGARCSPSRLDRSQGSLSNLWEDFVTSSRPLVFRNNCTLPFVAIQFLRVEPTTHIYRTSHGKPEICVHASLTQTS